MKVKFLKERKALEKGEKCNNLTSAKSEGIIFYLTVLLNMVDDRSIRFTDTSTGFKYVCVWEEPIRPKIGMQNAKRRTKDTAFYFSSTRIHLTWTLSFSTHLIIEEAL